MLLAPECKRQILSRNISKTDADAGVGVRLGTNAAQVECKFLNDG